MPRRHPIKLLPSAAYLRTRLNYNPKTGKLRWRNGPRAGKLTGASVNRNYYTISIAGNVYLVHRVIWKWMTMAEPPISIDHRDMNGTNNRWANLRDATALQQQHNRRWLTPNAANRRGVYPSSKNRWIARIRYNHARLYLGSFPSIEAAAAAYEAAAKRIRKELFPRRKST
jgi:hypothetical protein